VSPQVAGLISAYPPPAPFPFPIRPPLPPVLGSWTYRSFVNSPDIGKDFNDLELGRGELTIEHFAPGIFVGRLSFGDSYQFRLRGMVDPNPPCTVRFTGIGDTRDSRDQVYDYVGFFIPMWSNGVDQRPVLVGSTVRSVAHNGGRAKAGMVGSFIAVQRDEREG
jgi:hypothetical protein